LRALPAANGTRELAERRDAFFARRDHFENLFRRVVQTGIDQGDFAAVDVPVFTRTLLGANNWVAVWYREGGRMNGTQIADQITETFLRALRP
ncbi:MAG: hypothetical protein K8J31_08525, partial [Anaerolineae bacterium]|nr:hypothetical protein [Anaerolineae bacterium]